MTEQLNLFEGDGADPGADDLDGLLLGPGHVVTRGAAARVSVLIDDAWRAEALVTEFTARELGGEYDVARDGGDTRFVARTDFAPDLTALARRWSRVPQVRLRPAGLRLWAIAGGRYAQPGYVFALAPTAEARWPAAGAALAALGVPGVLLGPRGGGPAVRIGSERRLRRLRSLLGAAPAGAAPHDWP